MFFVQPPYYRRTLDFFETQTTSGVSVNASSKASEWVVTMSSVRVEASTNKSASM